MSSFLAMNRKVRQGQATRERLLSTASELFLEHGYEHTSIEQVLERAQISRGALYHHFHSKRDLYEGVLEHVEARIATACVRAARTHDDPLEALKAGCHAFLALARDPQVKHIVLTDAPAVIGWRRWREIDERHAFGIFKAALAAVPSVARLSPIALDTLAHVLLASLIELATLIANSNTPRTAEHNARTTLDELLDRLLGK